MVTLLFKLKLYAAYLQNTNKLCKDVLNDS